MSRRIRRIQSPTVLDHLRELLSPAGRGGLGPSRSALLWRGGALGVTFCAGLALTSLTATAQTQQGQRDANKPLKVKLSSSAYAAQGQPKAEDKEAAAAPSEEPVAATAPSKKTSKVDWSKIKIDLSKAKVEDGRYVQRLSDGTKVTLTIDPSTQQKLEKTLLNNKVHYGGVVLIEPETGKVLAMVDEHRGDEAAFKDIALKSPAPSASVFKIITIAALLEEGKAKADEKVCYHGGRSSLTKGNIEGSAKLDRSCGTLSDAMAWSINSIIAKLAFHRLNKNHLERWAQRFGYNEKIPFELPIEMSKATIPDDPHERARSAAGFWHSTLSPLHGAMIGAAIINDGVMMVPTLVERVEDGKGRELHRFEAKVWRRAVSLKTARALKEMMDRTTSVGTARKYFRQRREFPSSKILTGGKTGTLSRKSPSYLGYTWFVGYGQAKSHSELKVGVGGLVCNTPIWHIKGPYAASEAVRMYIEGELDRLKDKT